MRNVNIIIISKMIYIIALKMNNVHQIIILLSQGQNNVLNLAMILRVILNNSEIIVIKNVLQ